MWIDSVWRITPPPPSRSVHVLNLRMKLPCQRGCVFPAKRPDKRRAHKPIKYILQYNNVINITALHRHNVNGILYSWAGRKARHYQSITAVRGHRNFKIIPSNERSQASTIRPWIKSPSLAFGDVQFVFNVLETDVRQTTIHVYIYFINNFNQVFVTYAINITMYICDTYMWLHINVIWHIQWYLSRHIWYILHVRGFIKKFVDCL